MESVHICGSSPMVVAGWKINRSPMGGFSMRHQETGEVRRGLGAQYWSQYMIRIGWPIEMLDRRSWIWRAYVDVDGKLVEIDSWPDPRPYPYPAAARR